MTNSLSASREMMAEGQGVNILAALIQGGKARHFHQRYCYCYQRQLPNTLESPSP